MRICSPRVLPAGSLHARSGLTTNYLGDEWFDGINSALQVARESDGYLWLYDEDLWPSGNAGGQVAGTKDEYRSTMLWGVLVAPGVSAPEMKTDEEIGCCYAIKQRDGLVLNEFEAVPLDKVSEAQQI